MKHPRTIRRLGPTGLIAVLLTLSMTLFGAAVVPDGYLGGRLAA